MNAVKRKSYYLLKRDIYDLKSGQKIECSLFQKRFDSTQIKHFLESGIIKLYFKS